MLRAAVAAAGLTLAAGPCLAAPPTPVVPPSQSRQVAQAAALRHRLVEVPGAGHDDRELLDGDSLVHAVVELVAASTGP